MAFPLRRLHALTDERIESLLLAGAEFFDRLRIVGEHFVDDLLEGAGVGNLLEAELFDQGIDVRAFLGPERREDGLGPLLIDVPSVMRARILARSAGVTGAVA